MHTFPDGRTLPLGQKTCVCDEAQAEAAEEERQREERSRQHDEWERQQRLEALFRKSMLPERWRARTFNDFQATPQNQQAYEQALAYADSFDPTAGEGLLFTGTVGTGKTHLSAAIAMRLIEQEHTVVFGTVNTILMQLRNTFDDSRSKEQEVFNRLTRCQLLIIDDLGKEKVTDWVEQSLYEIVNARYEANKSLIITTNMSLTQLRNRYPNVGDAMVDRIIEMCQGVRMNGDSWRKKAAMK